MIGLLATIGLSKLFTIIGLCSLGVIVTGPLFSLSASGQLGKSLVYSEWKGRKYVREYVIPHNPNSLAQLFQRAYFGAISKWWAIVTPTQRATWQDLADQGEYSTFNAYCAANLDAETNGELPVTTTDGTGDSTGSDAPATLTAVGGINHITVTVTGGGDVSAADLLIVSLGTAGGANTTSSTITRTVYGQTNVAPGQVIVIPLTNIPAGSYFLGAAMITGIGDHTSWTHNATAVVVTGS